MFMKSDHVSHERSTHDSARAIAAFKKRGRGGRLTQEEMKGMDGVITVAIGCLLNNELRVEYNVQTEDYEAQVEACGNKHRAPEEHRCEAEPHLIQRQQSVGEEI